MEYIAFDCHKRYTWAVVEDEQGRLVREEEDTPPAGELAGVPLPLPGGFPGGGGDGGA